MIVLRDTANDPRTLAAVEWLLLAVLLGSFVILGFLPGWRSMNSDFPNYFLPAFLHHQGISIDRAYEWRWFQRHKDYAQIDQPLLGFVPNPPMCAVPLLPVASLPSLDAKRVWLIFDLVLMALSLGMLRRVTELPWRRLLLLTFLCILPLRDNFHYGQYYVVILALLCGAYYAACCGHRFTAGAILAMAGWLKIFPAFFLILFLRKRNWRAAAGLIAGGVVLGAASVLLFGWHVHQILLLEVLPRALHGDLVSPHVPQWNSFTALCHQAFLLEPELNPTPWINSVAAYSLIQALISIVLLFAFLFSTGDEETPQTRAWEWSTFVVLLLLLSSMPSSYHHCILIFSAIIAVDYLLKRGERRAALAAAILFALACSPMPEFVFVHLQGRLAAIFLLYLLLLFKAPARMASRQRKAGFAVATALLAVFTLSNLRAHRNLAEDFSRRLTPVYLGYGTFSVTRAGDRLVVDEMVEAAYSAVMLPQAGNEERQRLRAPGDVVAIAASAQSPFIYFEVVRQHSQIFRLPVAQLGRADAVLEYVAEGYDPVVSADGHWLAYLRDKGGRTVIMLSKDDSSKDVATAAPARGSQNLAGVLEMSVTAQGNLIVATGSAGDPYLVSLNTASGEARALREVRGAVRYPAVSPDGKWLAFSRRESGAWHLFARDLDRGAEQQLTSAPCNATSPAWEDEHALLYISDCGRGFTLGAPARVVVRQ
jgi:glycosyl transferase family 87/WD40 repeat protein